MYVSKCFYLIYMGVKRFVYFEYLYDKISGTHCIHKIEDKFKKINFLSQPPIQDQNVFTTYFIVVIFVEELIKHNIFFNIKKK